jgi:hypothetical protein
MEQSSSREADGFSAAQQTAPSALQRLHLTTITDRYCKQELLQTVHFVTVMFDWFEVLVKLKQNAVGHVSYSFGHILYHFICILIVTYFLLLCDVFFC